MKPQTNGHGQQRQCQGQPVAKHPQFLRAQGGFQPGLAGLLQRVQAGLGLVGGLLCVERPLLLFFHLGQRLALGGLEPVERGGARDQPVVLARPFGRAAGGQPVAESVAGTGRVGLGGLVLQARLVQRVGGGLLGTLRRLDLGPGGAGLCRVHEVVQGVAGFDLWQVTHQRAAQADQEAGKHQRHQPQTTVEPFFRQSQGFAHGGTPGHSGTDAVVFSAMVLIAF